MNKFIQVLPIKKNNFIKIIIITCFIYYSVLGFSILDSENFSWLQEEDFAHAYIGWLFFKGTPWTMPLGMNPDYGLELASSIIYTDSIPLFALVFKAFSPLLSSDFQYFGYWLFFCIFMQTLFGMKLIGLFTTNNKIIFLGSILFALSPPMIWRMQVHLTLAGHFLILAAIYLALQPGLKNRSLKWLILLNTSILVHAYFFAMVLAIWLADLAGKFTMHSIRFKYIIISLLITIFSVGITAWLSGYFSVGTGIGAHGFGYWRMNVFSIVDSDGWSYILKDIPGGAGDYEGFNFLGTGIIFMILAGLIKINYWKSYIPKILKRFWSLLILFFLLTIFALSHNVGIGSYDINIEVNDHLLKLANIFRSSGRFFWPIHYMLVLFSIFVILKYYPKNITVILILLAIIIQYLDTSSGWLKIREMHEISSQEKWEIRMKDSFWEDVPKRYSKIRYIPAGNQLEHWKSIAYYAIKKNLSTDSIYMARVKSGAISESNSKASEMLESGKFENDSIYLMDKNSFEKAIPNVNPTKDLSVIIDGFHVIAPGWIECLECNTDLKKASS